jgi:hypothetical protein
MDQAATLIKNYITLVVEKQTQEQAKECLAELAGETAFGKLVPKKNTLTTVKGLFLKIDGADIDHWGDFLADHESYYGVFEEGWADLVSTANEEHVQAGLALEGKVGGVEPGQGGAAPRPPYVQPRVVLALPTWASVPGTCSDWVEGTVPVVMQLKVAKADWYGLLLQSITGTGQDDFKDIKETYPNAGIDEWLERLVRIYDVDAEAQLAKKLKELTMKTSFSALRIELQRIAKRLNKFDGWELGEEALVVWAGLAMRQDHWTTLQREKPKTLTEMQRLMYSLRLELPAYVVSTIDEASAMAVTHERPRPQASKELCKRFEAGRCPFGDKCHFFHPSEVCHDYLRGKCKRANCRFLHEKSDKVGPGGVPGPCFHCGGPHLRHTCKEYKLFMAKGAGTVNAVHLEQDQEDLRRILTRLGYQKMGEANSVVASESADSRDKLPTLDQDGYEYGAVY